MVELDWRTARVRGVTLVAATLDARGSASGVEAHRVAVRCRTGGTVYPPRREGVPAAGWDGGRVEVTVQPGTVRGVGFATPEPPREPPVEIDDVRPAAGSEPAGRSGGDSHPADPSPADVLRALGDPSPPRDAVPAAAAADGETGARETSPGTARETGEQSDRVRTQSGTEERIDAADRSDADRTGEREDRCAPAVDGADPAVPPAIRGWLDGLEERIDVASSPALSREAARLRRIQRRAGALAVRAERARTRRR